MNDITADVAKALQSSMLQRVPEIAAELVRGGMEPTEAIKQAITKAKEREEELCLMMIAPEGYWQREAVNELKDAICTRVYNRLRAMPPADPAPINPQWIECEKAIGHKPTAHEFIMWHRSAK